MRPLPSLLLLVAALGSLPAPCLTADQWREDLQFALDDFLPRDRSFDERSRQRFREAIGELRSRVASLSDAQVMVGLARAVALSGNAHTRLYLLRNRTELRRYPFRVWWFDEGLYVVRASPSEPDLVGARILRLGRHSVQEARAAVGPLFAGNASWRSYMSAYSLTSPDVLIALGIVEDSGALEMEFEDASGARRKRVLSPLPLVRSDQPVESWRDLASPAKAQALYLRSPDVPYWSHYLDRERLLYVQLNRSGEPAGGEPFANFARRVLEELLARAPAKLVVDLRFNTGGNLMVARSFFEHLAAAAVQGRIPVYVITGRATFSAGLFHAMQLRQHARATIVGEPPGDELDFWAEGGNAIAPNSRLSLHYADRFHSYSCADPGKAAPYLMAVSDLCVKSAAPDIPVGMSHRDYLEGRDAALEAIARQ